MQGSEIIVLITHATYILLSVIALIEYIKNRDRARLEVFLLFGAFGLLILLQRVQPSLGGNTALWAGKLASILFLSHPYLLLRLIQHLQEVPASISWFALSGMLFSWATAIILPNPLPPIVAVVIVLYFVVVDGYSAYAMINGARKSSGVTYNRLLLAAIGSGVIAILIFLSGIGAVFPRAASFTTPITQILGLVSVAFYFLGFAPPYRLRRTWQLEEFYRFLHGTSMSQTEQADQYIFVKLANAAQRAVGGDMAVVALWSEEENRLVVQASSSPGRLPSSDLEHPVFHKAWQARKSGIIQRKTDPRHPESNIPGPRGSNALFVVPIATTERAWGLLVVYLFHSPLFAQDDLDLLERLCEQTAVSLGYVDMLVRQEKLIDRLRRYNQRLEAIKEIDRGILAARLPEKIAKVSLSHMQRVVPADRSTVVLFDHEKRQVQFLATEERIKLGQFEKASGPFDDFNDVEFLSGDPIIIGDSRAEGSFPKIGEKFREQGFCSLIIIPLKVDQKLIGALSLSAIEPNTFHQEHQEIAREVASQLAITIQQAGLREELQRTNMELEQRVVERTTELAKVVQELQEEIQARQQASEELHAAQDRLQFLLSATPAIIYSASSANKQQVTFVSDNVLSQLGYEAKQFLENSLFWTECIHPEDKDRVLSRLEEWPPTGHHALEYRFQHKEGHYLWLHDEYRYICNEEGIPVEIVGYWIDNTKRRQAEDVIQNLNRDLSQRAHELQEANRELEAFAYSVSHDLRAPLRAIDGFSQVLMSNYSEELSPEAFRYLQRVRDNTQEMGTLIDDLLAFSRINQQSLEMKPVEAAGVARMALQSLSKDYEGREIDIRIQDLPPCVGDPILVKQVFTNLLSNAIKFTSQREKAVVEVGGRSENGEVIYYVKDNGIGFDMQYSSKLFGVFQRLHRSEEYEGTGVGLAIVQRIVNRHGGRAWAEAVPNQGATFYFALPARKPTQT